jgi:hypothetical protein
MVRPPQEELLNSPWGMRPDVQPRPIDSQIWESCSARLASCLKNGEKGCNPLRFVLWHWLKLSMIPVRFEFLAGGISSHLK